VTKTESVLSLFKRKAVDAPLTAYPPLDLFFKHDLPDRHFVARLVKDKNWLGDTVERQVWTNPHRTISVSLKHDDSTNISTVILRTAKGATTYTFTGGDRDAKNLNSLWKAIGMTPLPESAPETSYTESHSNSQQTSIMKTADIIKAVESAKSSNGLLSALCEDMAFTEGQEVFVAASVGQASLKGKYRGLTNGGYAKIEDMKGTVHTVLPHYIFARTSNL
jgi:hypothetical protein